MRNTISAILVIILLAFVAGLVFIIIEGDTGERFTEFYLLGPGGAATDYPSEVTLGEKIDVLAGVINQERTDKAYKIIVNIDGVDYFQFGPVELAHSEKWEHEISLTPLRAGKGQKVNFLLFWDGKDGAESLKESLHLWLDVEE
ncbi:DUF1616 domain-containing protein [Chloroflexota bacterium]